MRLRTAASIMLATALATGLAACYSLPQTQAQYFPSDGVNVSVGQVKLLNAVVITEDGVDGNLLATVVNESADDVEVLLQYQIDGVRTDLVVEVPAASRVALGFGDGGQLLLEGIDTPAGGLIPFYVQYGDVPGEQIDVPVLDTSLEYLEGHDPTPIPAPTDTATPAPGETPAP